jgi:hypothetical protein
MVRQFVVRWDRSSTRRETADRPAEDEYQDADADDGDRPQAGPLEEADTAEGERADGDDGVGGEHPGVDVAETDPLEPPGGVPGTVVFGHGFSRGPPPARR